MARRQEQLGLFSGSSPQLADVTTVTGAVDRITYRSEQTGYTVFRLALDDGDKTLTAVGKMAPISPGEQVRLQGRWIEHPKFGRQLEIIKVEPVQPSTREAVARYLGSGLAAGIGPKLAERIVDMFGEDTLDVIDTRPEELTQVHGVSPKKARALAEAVRDNQRLRDVTLLLEESGLGARYAARIHEKYGDSALTVVREDPYRLAREIWGIGFTRADALARNLGLAADHPDRIEAGLVHTLRRSAELGDIYVETENLIRATQDLLQVDVEVLEEGLTEAVECGRLVREEDRLYTIGLHRAETEAADRLREMLRASGDELHFDEGLLRRLQSERRVELSPDQVDAVRLAHERHVLVITGGPGTGKTTLTRFLVDLVQGLGLRVVLAAPTGRAARRLSEATGSEASTLHRLLGFDPASSDFARDEDHPLEADVVLVDEASMVDQRLFATLLAALPVGARLILVGDADQLPSVGAGEVLRDLIRSTVVPTARLKRIYRQGERSGIVTNAHRVLAGEWPETCDPGEGDFVFVERESPDDIAKAIRGLVKNFLPKQAGVNSVRDVQVLVPMYKGDAGADALNAALQQDLNPKAPEVKHGVRRFRRGDRVIQLRNDYSHNIFNGEIGHVQSLAEGGGAMTVQFDQQVELSAAEWDQLGLAYAITVHKSQGSEYDWVVFPLTTQHAIMLERPLFYTAITRAKKGVILVGSKRALSLALRSDRSRQRRTTLAARLRGDL